MKRKGGYTIATTEEILSYKEKMHRYHVRYGYTGQKRPKVSKAKRKRIFQRDKGICVYCGKQLKMDNFWIDHIKPLSRGGNNEDYNLAVSCCECNRKKGTKTASEFMEV